MRGTQVFSLLFFSFSPSLLFLLPSFLSFPFFFLSLFSLPFFANFTGKGRPHRLPVSTPGAPILQKVKSRGRCCKLSFNILWEFFSPFDAMPAYFICVRRTFRFTMPFPCWTQLCTPPRYEWGGQLYRVASPPRAPNRQWKRGKNWILLNFGQLNKITFLKGYIFSPLKSNSCTRGGAL